MSEHWRTAAAGLLALPAIGMWLARPGLHWTPLDFIVMGLLLATACGLYELGARLSGNRAFRAAFGLAALTGFLTIWVNLAVGMLGSEGDQANLMFAGVLAVAAVGSIVARFRPVGMAWAMARRAWRSSRWWAWPWPPEATARTNWR